MIINLKEVSLRNWEKDILKSITWQVRDGEHWALLGLNGSGKTSLLKLITGYEWASKGSIHVFNKRFGEVNIQNIRKKIGWVSASLDERFHIRTSDTVLETIISGKFASIGLYEDISKEDIERAEAIGQQFQLASLLHEPISVLSQGEKKKTMLARAWMSNPNLIILDEPCSGLDVYSREILLETIEAVAREKNGPTFIYVTHHIEEIMPVFSHALLLKQGEIINAGLKKEVVTEENISETLNLPLQLNWIDERPWLQMKKKEKRYK